MGCLRSHVIPKWIISNFSTKENTQILSISVFPDRDLYFRFSSRETVSNHNNHENGIYERSRVGVILTDHDTDPQLAYEGNNRLSYGLGRVMSWDSLWDETGWKGFIFYWSLINAYSFIHFFSFCVTLSPARSLHVACFCRLLFVSLMHFHIILHA